MKITKKPSTGGASAHVIIDSGTISGALPAGTNVIGHVIADTGSTTAVTGNVAVTSTDGALATVGNTSDAASASTLVGLLKNIKAALAGTLAVSGTFWQATQPISATSLPLPTGAAKDSTLTDGTLRVGGTVAAAQSGTWTVQPGNTANTVAWKVDGSAVTQPVSGTFWQATQPVSGTFWQATQPVSGTVAVSNAFALDSTVAKDATLASTNTKLDTIDTDLKANVSLAASTNVIGHVIVDTAPTTAITNIGLTDLDATIGTEDSSTIPTKAVMIVGKTVDAMPILEALPLGPQGRSLLVEPIAPSAFDIALLREMRLLRQSFQDWTGTSPREDPIQVNS